MSAPQSRHAARASIAVKVATPIGVLVTAAASLASLFGAIGPAPVELPAPAAAMALPLVDVAESTVANPCTDPDVVSALDSGDDATAVAAFGGAAQFRAAVVVGNAPCVSLDDPQRLWVVVNKLRPLPADFAPASLARIGVPATTRSNELRPDASQALESMAAAAREAGAGELGINNGYRSYSLQQRTYGTHVRERGQAGADAVSARPGYSEHQSGLAFDLVACSSSCGGLDAFGDTPQGRWVADNAWKHGFIVRYEAGRTDTTGYAPEPWHIRYVGVDLAEAYHEGGFHTLEEFFGLPAAPDYAH